MAIHARRALGSVLALGLAAVGLVGVAAPSQAADLTRGGAYVWLDDASTPLDTPYTPSAAYQYNSTSPWTPVNTVVRESVGTYIVTFPHLAWRGITHVTSYGDDGVTCSPSRIQQTGYPADLGVPGTGTDIWVRCLGLDGREVDHRFTISYTDVQSTYDNRPMAYLSADGDRPYVHEGSFNSSGGTNKVVKIGKGKYTVTLPGLASSSGHVMVTSWVGYQARAQCKVVNWGPSGDDEVVNVRCFNATGAAINTNFDLTYVDRLNILGTAAGFSPDGQDSAYVWANNAKSPSYVPDASYQFDNGVTTAASVTRTRKGAYTVAFTYADLSAGNVQVSAYGSGKAFCNVAWWTPSGIEVRCFDVKGAPMDSMYTLAFTGPFGIG